MKISYYHKDIQSFLDSLEKAVKAKVVSSLELLSIEDYHLSMPYSKRVEKDLYELRVSSLQNIRIFYTFYDGEIVLLYGFNKKTQRLTWNNLNTARRRLKDLHS